MIQLTLTEKKGMNRTQVFFEDWFMKMERIENLLFDPNENYAPAESIHWSMVGTQIMLAKALREKHLLTVLGRAFHTMVNDRSTRAWFFRDDVHEVDWAILLDNRGFTFGTTSWSPKSHPTRADKLKRETMLKSLSNLLAFLRERGASSGLEAPISPDQMKAGIGGK